MVLDRDLPVLHIAAQPTALGSHRHPTNDVNALFAALAARAADSDIPVWIAFLEGLEDEVMSGHRMVPRVGHDPTSQLR